RRSGELERQINQTISAELVAGTGATVRRFFAVGQLRNRSYDLEDQQLIAPENAASAWQIGGNASAGLVMAASSTDRYAELHYDFSRGDVVQLSQTFTTDFAVSRLHRIQFYLHNDDTWHAINLLVEKNGQRFRAAHPVDNADVNWVVATWQEPGPDD